LIKYLLFDLDGTITDSADGITASVSYALEHMGISEEKSNLYRFVGPPLVDSFREFYGFGEKEAQEGVRLYREYYAAKGIFENKVYPGIPHLLKKCREQGKKVILATSKPEVYAKQILEHFKLAEYFDDIQGSSMDGSKIQKEDVIQSALLDNGITDMQEVLMIGDRKHDVIGSGKFGISCVGVLYGYGSREELEMCGAKWITDTVEDLEAFLDRI
jgi:phosphoglycolate phosphatase